VTEPRAKHACHGVRDARQLVRDAARRLEEAGVPEAHVSAEVLLSELLGVGRSDLAVLEEPPAGDQATLYEAWISRRLKREPVQRILGRAYFRNLELELDKHTLIPRPDTESVVDAVLGAVDRRGGSCHILDIGTGSGAIAISIAQERPLCEVHATDSSNEALGIARHNAERAGVTVHPHLADLVSGLEGLADSVEVLVSNPPYIRSVDIPKLAPEVRDWDPPAALDGGPDGLDFYRRIFAEVKPLLASGADVVLEVGDGQAEDVLELGRRAGYVPLGTHADLAGSPRAVLLRWGAG
jgi:release factor glutamine methyltransferase